MVRETYQKQLRDLREGVIELSVKVYRQMEQGLDALVNGDLALADKLDAYDDAIDRQSLELEKLCVQLLALQQPVAVDLRLITASYKIATDLERVGDLAVNLGEYARDSQRLEMVPASQLRAAGDIALAMFSETMQAYEHKDLKRAEAVVQRDSELDRECWRIIRAFIKQLMFSQLKEHGEAEAEQNASQALTVLLSMRDLERIGDHAVNIAARVVYLVSGSHQYI